jgi:hypothetical protein
MLVTAAVCAWPPRSAHAGNGVDLVRYMPEDSTVMMVIDVSGARSSKLFELGMQKLVALAPSGFATVEAAGVDPATALDTIAIGGRIDGGKEDFSVVADGKQAQLIAALIAKAPEAKATTYHGVTYYGNADGSIALVGKKLVFAKPEHIERAIDLALGKLKNASKSPKAAALRAVIAATDTRHDVWAAVVIPPDLDATAKAQGLDLEGISLGASLSSSLSVELKVVNGTDASATTMLGQINLVLPQLGPALGNLGLGAAAKTLTVDKDGAIVRMAITLSEAELSTIAALVQSSLGSSLFGGP